uniref:tRNA (uracil-O(2)-)-methyltransferase n=1 Tax=Meloidogyne hapla TaxID=6305 RepID=A0A1I8B5R7_MELHA
MGRSTIKLLDETSYQSTYNRIKQIHGRRIIEDWTERTDPLKYVIEDCGIAAYLIELWTSQKILPTKCFADLGCGNGLLVYLLEKEGINGGFGLDVRRRKIWTKFEKEGINLKEIVINPDCLDENLVEMLNNVDFLIGNHSDELTPWIPILAARLGCNFFLLPCCPYNFFSKFCKITPSAQQKKDGIIGGLQDQFYNYLEKIIIRLGFKLIKDQLRIPSRKNKCFIGIIPETGLVQNLEEIINELLMAAKVHKKSFAPRQAVEQVRNCSRLPLDAKIGLARRVVDYLMNQKPENINGWRCSGPVHLSKLSEDVLTEDDRKMLSEQDKGMQTFLRGQHQTFLVECAHVSIRKWPLVNSDFMAKASNGKIRKTDCWFFKWHPDG